MVLLSKNLFTVSKPLQHHQNFGDIMTHYEIPEPDTWVTDRELALMNTLDCLFPEGEHLLCTWHVNMNILANCRKYYPADLKDPSKKTLANPQVYVPDPKWTNFLKDWAALVDSPTNSDYNTALLSSGHTKKKLLIMLKKCGWFGKKSWFDTRWISAYTLRSVLHR